MHYHDGMYVLQFPSEIQKGIRKSLYRALRGSYVHFYNQDDKLIEGEFNRLSPKHRKEAIDHACSNKIRSLDGSNFNSRYWVDKANRLYGE